MMTSKSHPAVCANRNEQRFLLVPDCLSLVVLMPRSHRTRAETTRTGERFGVNMFFELVALKIMFNKKIGRNVRYIYLRLIETFLFLING